MLAAAALATLALPTHAFADESLSATGSITYTWQGDPARGCAQAGLCGVQGEMIVAPQGDTSANTFRGTIKCFDLQPDSDRARDGSRGRMCGYADGSVRQRPNRYPPATRRPRRADRAAALE